MYKFQKFWLTKAMCMLKQVHKTVRSDGVFHRYFLFRLTGVQKWEKRCNQNILKQNEIGVRAWIRTMDERIKSLGGEGVVRFQKNLFRAFDELFESGNVPSKQATKAVTVLQRVRRIRQVSENSFIQQNLQQLHSIEDVPFKKENECLSTGSKVRMNNTNHFYS